MLAALLVAVLRACWHRGADAPAMMAAALHVCAMRQAAVVGVKGIMYRGRAHTSTYTLMCISLATEVLGHTFEQHVRM